MSVLYASFSNQAHKCSLGAVGWAAMSPTPPPHQARATISDPLYHSNQGERTNLGGVGAYDGAPLYAASERHFRGARRVRCRGHASHEILAVAYIVGILTCCCYAFLLAANLLPGLLAVSG